MTQQMSAGRAFIGGRGFSSVSAMGGLGGHRTYVASVGHPIGNGSGVRCFSSQSLSNLGGSRRISHGGYGGYGSGYYGGYGAYGYGHIGYGTLGFGGRMGHLGNGGLLGGYSSFRGDGIRGVTINENLLKPLHVGVDPQENEARNQEREEMKTLNDQFACFIDKVRYLEQQNKVLETKWNLLQECAVPAKKSLEPYYENFISNMKKQLDFLLSERDQLTKEEASIQHLVEEFKSGYEKELKRRTDAENEFVLLKKDVDCIFLSKEELEGKLDLLSRELEFRTCVHAEELAQLDSQVYDTNILLQMDNSRNLDVDLIIKNVEAWYQSIAHRSKEEANALYENRFLELQEQRGKYSDDLKINQHEIAELTRLLHKMQSEHDIVKKQVDCLQSSICDVEQRGDVALKDARDKHTELQTALQKAKDDLARLLKDYHELLNTKLALDIEIATYKTLLEGEESRISTGNFVSIDVVNPPYIEDSLGYPAACGYGPDTEYLEDVGATVVYVEEDMAETTVVDEVEETVEDMEDVGAGVVHVEEDMEDHGVEAMVEAMVEAVVEDTVEVDMVEAVVKDTVEADMDMVEGLVDNTVEANMVEGLVEETVEVDMVEGLVEETAEVDMVEGLVVDTVEADMVEAVVEDTVEADMVENLVEGVGTGAPEVVKIAQGL
ncbi:keratin, type II cytoskeletal 7-like [Eublepharis macularius]|uniref:Keratin, type II cytoskeletal 7-like n=1 Tax=Eublepharis macularius TaxID=481883 RepID=A0AA97LKF3_EUBMA|nr:keratin, type II cytoskeletal 7-like [Eublepharis macularius]